MDLDKLLDRTKKDLRSVLISAPRGVPARLLLTDFKMVLGYELPFRQLGFQKLPDFIHTIPDVVRVDRVNGEPTCQAVADASTQQIARFVATQKKPKLKRSNAPPLVRKPQVYSGFTKKSKFGPRPSPRRASYGGGGARPKPAYNNYSRGPVSRPTQQGPPRFRAASQLYRPIMESTFRPSTRSNLGGFSQSAPNTPGGPSRPTQAQINNTPAKYMGNGPSPGPGSSSGSHGGVNASQSSSSVSSGYSDKIGSSAIRGSSSSSSSSFAGSAKGGPPREGSFYSKAPSARTVSGKPTVIKDLEERCRKTPLDVGGMICVDGYIAGEKRHDLPNSTVKYLLYTGINNRRGEFPAVMLFFKKEAWNIEDESLDFQNIPFGSKLRVIGLAVSMQNKQKACNEPAMKVFNYTYLNPSSNPSPRATKSPSGSAGASQATPSPPRPSAPTAEPSPLLKKTLFDLFKNKASGIWSKRIGSEFKKLHRKDPPGNLLEIALGLPFITRDEEAGNDMFIVRLKDGITEYPGEQPQVTFTTEKPELPGTVEFTSNEYFDVNVTYIDNPISFYLTRVGKDFSDELERMTEKMSSHFSQTRIQPVSGIEENQLYGYPWYVDNEIDSWCRVLTSRVTGKTADIFFPDYGNSETVSVADLVDLPREFYSLPFQAVHCCLHGCTGVREEATQLFIKTALEKYCVAQIMDSSGTRLSVELIDPDSASQTTINSIIMTAMHPISTLVPSLPKPGEARVPVILTDVDEDGVITVQLKGPGFNRLQHLMTLINEKYKKCQASDFVTQVTEGKIYCTKFTHDSKFYRVLIKKGIPKKLLVEYIDYGNEDETDIRKIRKPLDDPLFNLPPQAVKCRLHGLISSGKHWSDRALANYLDCDDLYLTTVESGKGSDLPVVKLTIVDGDNADSADEDDLSDLILKEYENNLAEAEESSMDISEPEYSTDSSNSRSPKHEAQSDGPSTPESLLSKSSISKSSTIGPSTPIYSPGPSEASPHTPSSLPLSPLNTSALAISSPLFSPSHLSAEVSMSDEDVLLAAAALSLREKGQEEVPTPPPPASPRPELQFALLSSEEPQPVSVVYADSPHFFIIQLLSENDHLESMMNVLNDPALSRDSVRPKDMKEGLICSTCSSMDERWYRVWLIGPTPPGPNVLVGFLDYGGTEVVKKSDLKYLPDEFLRLPFQGIACTLQAVKPAKGGEWSEEATAWFSDRVLDKILYAMELTKDKGHSCITLLDTSLENKTVDIRESLKNAGFAKSVKNQRN